MLVSVVLKCPFRGNTNRSHRPYSAYYLSILTSNLIFPLTDFLQTHHTEEHKSKDGGLCTSILVNLLHGYYDVWIGVEQYN